MRKIYLGLVLLLGSSAAMAQGETCGTALPITTGVISGDGPSTGGGAFGSGVNADWYSFTAPCNGTITASACGLTTEDTHVHIYEGACPPGHSATVDNDDACGFQSETSISASAGTTYYIEWTDDWDNGAFDWQLSYVQGGPSGVTVVGTTFDSGTIDWDDSGSSSWVIEYGISGFTPGSGTIWNITAASDTVIDGLNPETTYEFYVSTTGPCAATAGPFSFTTDPVCAPPTGLTATPGTSPNTDEALLDWTPGGTEVQWDVEYGPAGFVLGSATQWYGITAASDTTAENLTGLTDYHWYVRAVCDVTAPLDTFSLWVGPETFTTNQPCADVPLASLDTIGGDFFNAGLTWTPGGLESEWNVQWGETGFTLGGTGSNAVNGVTTTPEMISNLTPGTTYDFYVQAVCGSSADSLATWVGPFTWTQPILCQDPSAGTFAGLTTSSVDFSWTSNGSETDWTVEYGVDGFTLGTGTQVQTTSTTANITGLSGGTDYCFYVQANCGSTPDSASAWVGPFCITTLVSCPQPTNLNAINITTTAANLIWQAGGSETEWDLEWGLPGFTPGTGAFEGNVNPTSTNPYYATGLSLGATYEFYVRGICGAGDTSVWAGPYSFATLCGTFTAPYEENFDALLTTPTCWTNPGGGEPWIFEPSGASGLPNPAYGVAGSVDHTSGTGNYAWIDASGTIGTNELISPEIDLTALTNPQAGFWLLSNNITDGAQNTISLDVWNGFGWINLGEYGGNNSDWIEIAYTLPMGIPSVTQFRLVQNVSTTGTGIPQHNDLLVDDFFVREEIPCPTPDAGTAIAGPFCTDPNEAVDLFDALTGFSDGNGTFYFPDAQNPVQSFAATNGSMLLTGLDAGVDYTFDYVVTSGCGSDTVSIVYNWEAQPNAGGDGAVTTCVNNSVVLFQELVGNPTSGGDWTDVDGTGQMFNGIYNPGASTPGTYDFLYIVTNGNCADSAFVVVTVEGCAGIEDAELVVEAYPNPVQDVLNVNLANVDGQVQVELFTIQGSMVAAPYVVNNSNITINMEEVAGGVYMLRVTSNGVSQDIRVVKQ
jgi:hypothetical protein